MSMLTFREYIIGNDTTIFDKLELFTEMAMQHAVVRNPVLIDEDDIRFLKQFEPKYWPKALYIRYDKYLRQALKIRCEQRLPVEKALFETFEKIALEYQKKFNKGEKRELSFAPIAEVCKKFNLEMPSEILKKYESENRDYFDKFVKISLNVENEETKLKNLENYASLETHNIVKECFPFPKTQEGFDPDGEDVYEIFPDKDMEAKKNTQSKEDETKIVEKKPKKTFKAKSYIIPLIAKLEQDKGKNHFPESGLSGQGMYGYDLSPPYIRGKQACVDEFWGFIMPSMDVFKDAISKFLSDNFHENYGVIHDFQTFNNSVYASKKILEEIYTFKNISGKKFMCPKKTIDGQTVIEPDGEFKADKFFLRFTEEPYKSLKLINVAQEEKTIKTPPDIISLAKYHKQKILKSQNARYVQMTIKKFLTNKNEFISSETQKQIDRHGEYEFNKAKSDLLKIVETSYFPYDQAIQTEQCPYPDIITLSKYYKSKLVANKSDFKKVIDFINSNDKQQIEHKKNLKSLYGNALYNQAADALKKLFEKPLFPSDEEKEKLSIPEDLTAPNLENLDMVDSPHPKYFQITSENKRLLEDKFFAESMKNRLESKFKHLLKQAFIKQIPQTYSESFLEKGGKKLSHEIIVYPIDQWDINAPNQVPDNVQLNQYIESKKNIVNKKNKKQFDFYIKTYNEDPAGGRKYLAKNAREFFTAEANLLAKKFIKELISLDGMPLPHSTTNDHIIFHGNDDEKITHPKIVFIIRNISGKTIKLPIKSLDDAMSVKSGDKITIDKSYFPFLNIKGANEVLGVNYEFEFVEDSSLGKNVYRIKNVTDDKIKLPAIITRLNNGKTEVNPNETILVDKDNLQNFKIKNIEEKQDKKYDFEFVKDKNGEISYNTHSTISLPHEKTTIKELNPDGTTEEKEIDTPRVLPSRLLQTIRGDEDSEEEEEDEEEEGEEGGEEGEGKKFKTKKKPKYQVPENMSDRFGFHKNKFHVPIDDFTRMSTNTGFESKQAINFNKNSMGVDTFAKNTPRYLKLKEILDNRLDMQFVRIDDVPVGTKRLKNNIDKQLLEQMVNVSIYQAISKVYTGDKIGDLERKKLADCILAIHDVTYDHILENMTDPIIFFREEYSNSEVLSFNDFRKEKMKDSYNEKYESIRDKYLDYLEENDVLEEYYTKLNKCVSKLSNWILTFLQKENIGSKNSDICKSYVTRRTSSNNPFVVSGSAGDEENKPEAGEDQKTSEYRPSDEDISKTDQARTTKTNLLDKRQEILDRIKSLSQKLSQDKTADAMKQINDLMAQKIEIIKNQIKTSTINHILSIIKNPSNATEKELRPHLISKKVDITEKLEVIEFFLDTQLNKIVDQDEKTALINDLKTKRNKWNLMNEILEFITDTLTLKP